MISPSLLHLRSLGNSPEDESVNDSSLGDCPMPCRSSVPGLWFSWLLMLITSLWQLVFAD